jgi:hypothetical protein
MNIRIATIVSLAALLVFAAVIVTTQGGARIGDYKTAAATVQDGCLAALGPDISQAGSGVLVQPVRGRPTRPPQKPPKAAPGPDCAAGCEVDFITRCRDTPIECQRDYQTCLKDRCGQRLTVGQIGAL